MRLEVQTDLALDDAVHEQAYDGEHRQGRNPFGFLAPYRADRRGMLDPAKARFYSGVLPLIGLENLGIGTDRSADRRGQYRPSIILFSVVQGLDLDHKAITGLCRGWSRLGWPPTPCTPCGARGSHDAIPYRVIPPGLGPAATPTWSPVLILCNGRCGIRLTGQPPGLHLLHVRSDGAGFLPLRVRIRLRLLLGQLTRLDDDKAP
jgi:hypothetical protein